MTFRKYFFLAILLVIAVSCVDDGLVGDAVKPTQDQLAVNKMENLVLEAYSYHPDSLKTDGQSQLMLGSYWHELFGTVTADMALQFRFDAIQMDKEKVLADKVVIDSVFVILIFRDYYGDSLSLNEVNVYELKNQLSNFTDYYSNEDPDKFYDEEDFLGSAFFTGKEANVPDSVSSEPDYFYRVKVPLKKELGERFLDYYETIMAEENVPEQIDVFQSYFKGLYVKPILGNSTMLSIPTELTSTTSDNQSVVDFNNLQFYYHYKNDDNTEEDTARIQYFLYNNECGRFNRFNHDFQGTAFENSNEVHDDKLYLRGMGGMNIRIKCPSFTDHPELAPLPGNDSARIAINSAKLLLTVNQNAIDVQKFYPPIKIIVRTERSDTIEGFLRLIDDNSSFADDYLGGTLSSDGAYKYEFNITEQVQYWFTLPENQRDLIIQPVNSTVNPLFTIINGPNGVEDALKLDVVYSRY